MINLMYLYLIFRLVHGQVRSGQVRSGRSRSGQVTLNCAESWRCFSWLIAGTTCFKGEELFNKYIYWSIVIFPYRFRRRPLNPRPHSFSTYVFCVLPLLPIPFTNPSGPMMYLTSWGSRHWD